MSIPIRREWLRCVVTGNWSRGSRSTGWGHDEALVQEHVERLLQTGVLQEESRSVTVKPAPTGDNRYNQYHAPQFWSYIFNSKIILLVLQPGLSCTIQFTNAFLTLKALAAIQMGQTKKNTINESYLKERKRIASSLERMAWSCVSIFNQPKVAGQTYLLRGFFPLQQVWPLAQFYSVTFL